MKDSFLGKDTEVPSEGGGITFETPAPHCSTQPCQSCRLAKSLESVPYHCPAPHPSKERSVELIWKIHCILLHEACWGEAAPLSSPQCAVLHRATLQIAWHEVTARHPNPRPMQCHPDLHTGSPSADPFTLTHQAQQSY